MIDGMTISIIKQIMDALSASKSSGSQTGHATRARPCIEIKLANRKKGVGEHGHRSLIANLSIL